ncbi:hypothetical protein ACIQGT_40390 [Streptomyces sp. NPDC093108]|uniref:hypothetical protein n=1 Tax=unclassified Streptomyces TaxID=2593676 RepID=UPI0037F24F37
MRVRLTDGTRQIDISTNPDEQTTLDQVEATAIRLLTALDCEPTDEQHAPIGFTALDLDRVSLDSTTERADQTEPEHYDEPEDDRA